MIDWRTGAMMSLVGLLLLSTSACSNIRETFGLNKRAPDEFTVVRKPPLVIPPNFSLRPPNTAAAEAPRTETIGQAKAALIGNAALTKPGSQSAQGAKGGAPANSVGEQALLAHAGAEKANPGIRGVILRETTQLEERDRSFTDKLIFWREAQAPEQIVDAKKEASRLRQASATGKSPTESATPVIQRRKRAILEGIF